jgi:hypothetical protein
VIPAAVSGRMHPTATVPGLGLFKRYGRRSWHLPGFPVPFSSYDRGSYFFALAKARMYLTTLAISSLLI